ncbi:hypothetical protein ACE3MQ_24895 [Paenibacillus lentus]|uniref:hypothetical protein n=1 Tax=Paenibacillus lentus TaxID=1338368 RepID=UPI003653D95E
MIYDADPIRKYDDGSLYLHAAYLLSITSKEFVTAVLDHVRFCRLEECQFNIYYDGRTTLHYIERLLGLEDPATAIGIIAFNPKTNNVKSTIISMDDLKRFKYMGLSL